MEKAAAKSEEGELYVRLGNVYLDGDQFSKSADSIIKGLNKGGVKRPDQARLALGMAYFNLGDYDEARKAFRAAGKEGARRKEMAALTGDGSAVDCLRDQRRGSSA